jgi:hypothetical protein
VYLDNTENVRFLSLFDKSGMNIKGHFIKSRIFDRPFTVTKIDQGIRDYYMRLTTFFGQFRAVGNNYNQIVKTLHSNFTEKKALAFLYKLEQATIELVEIHRQVIALTEELKTNYLNDGRQD